MASGERLSEGTFKKCDMHVHSSSCYSRNYEEAAFFENVLNSDLDVLAVTDHNSVDVDLLTKLATAMAVKDKTLIGGVELNVKLKESTIDAHHLVLGKGKKGEYFHTIVWFSLEHAAAMASIVRELFAAAILGREVEDGEEEYYLSQASPKAFSKNTEGIAIYLEDFQDRVSSIPHFFIPHENKDRSLSDYLPNSSSGKSLLENQSYKDKLFYYSSAMAVEGGDKSRKHISEGLAKELSTTVAALFFSDATNASEIGSRFTWIDFDGDLDSLLLAISDPESRIRTSDVQPTLPQTNTASFLESVTFDTIVADDTLKRRPIILRFSPGYNGVVGSRGSGKTLLASLLASRNLSTYAKFVDADSVKFITHGGTPTVDHPTCLYLGQGELESIYRDGNYEEIPFLGERVTPLKESASKESDKARERLTGILDLEKKMVLAFCAKYISGAVHIDHLDADVPSGITITAPPSTHGDRCQIGQAITRLSSVAESLENAATDAKTICFKSVYPEDDKLFTALEAEARAVQKDVLEVAERVEKFSLLLDEADPDWFKYREQLLELFSTTLGAYNSESDATTLTQYNGKTAKALAFIDDLLELRLSLAYLDEAAKTAYEKSHHPIDPIKLQNAGEEIAIGLVYDADSTYEEKIGALLKSAESRDGQALAEAFLRQYDKGRLHDTFNGTKFKSISGRGVKEHYNKYFELLASTVAGQTSPRILVTIDGQPIDNMSPGMKAQALLKLFLNDEIVAGRWMYIVLDQPEDNLDVATIKEFLIDRLKKLKLNVQFFVVSHSAPVIVNGDARTVIVCENDGESIDYTYGAMNEIQVKQSIANVLDGGERYLKMRLNKYNFQVGDKQ